MHDDYITSSLLSKIAINVNKYNSCYIDLLHNNSKNKQKRVEEELQQAKFLVFLKSESASKSNWVQRELELAMENNIKILEVAIDKLKTESEINQLVIEAITKLTKANQHMHWIQKSFA